MLSIAQKKCLSASNILAFPVVQDFFFLIKGSCLVLIESIRTSYNSCCLCQVIIQNHPNLPRLNQFTEQNRDQK